MTENLAEQIATLCDTLKEFPAVRYRKYESLALKYIESGLLLKLLIHVYTSVFKGTRRECQTG